MVHRMEITIYYYIENSIEFKEKIIMIMVIFIYNMINKLHLNRTYSRKYIYILFSHVP